MAILYAVGSFEWNLVRSMLLMLLQLMFLGAIGILAGGFLSFWVACFTSGVALVFGVARDWIGKSVTVYNPSDQGLLMMAAQAVAWLMNVLLPDLAQTSPADSLEQGLQVSWLFLGEAAFYQLIVRGLLLLGLACWIFQRRELAKVQV